MRRGDKISPTPAPLRQSQDRAEQQARQAGENADAARAAAASPATPDKTALGALAAGRGDLHDRPGRLLDDAERQLMEDRFATRFDDVRMHDGSPVAELFGANAVTIGTDIHLAPGSYRPDEPAGQRLLGHELAHVVQQRQAVEPVAQFDIPGQSLPSALGVFEIEMTNAVDPGGEVGMQGTISFAPDAAGPYSTRIGLLQTVSTAKMQSTTVDPADQSGVPDPWAGTAEADRDVLATTGRGIAQSGWFVDAETAAVAQGDQIEPYYIGFWTAAENQYGHLRSPNDIAPTTLWDFPGAPYDQDFDFETAAVGADNQVVYGVLRWGFEVVSGAVQREYVFAEDTQTAEYDEAVERFRGFYSHEPVVIYFDTDSAVPIAGEAGKLADVPQYMTDYSDAVIELEGYADERGSSDYNSDLASRRADAVRALLESIGIAADRIDGLVPINETTEFGAAGAARRTSGNLQANRRVMIRFRRSASTPPVGP